MAMHNLTALFILFIFFLNIYQQFRCPSYLRKMYVRHTASRSGNKESWYGIVGNVTGLMNECRFH